MNWLIGNPKITLSVTRLLQTRCPDTQHGEVNGSLTNFAWIWGNIFQDGIEIDEIENRKRIGGFRVNSEQKCRMKQIRYRKRVSTHLSGWHGSATGTSGLFFRFCFDSAITITEDSTQPK